MLIFLSVSPSSVIAAYRKLNPLFTALPEVLLRHFVQFADFHLYIINNLVWCTQLLKAGACLHLIINLHGFTLSYLKIMECQAGLDWKGP